MILNGSVLSGNLVFACIFSFQLEFEDFTIVNGTASYRIFDQSLCELYSLVTDHPYQRTDAVINIPCIHPEYQQNNGNCMQSTLEIIPMGRASISLVFRPIPKLHVNRTVPWNYAVKEMPL